VEFDALGPYSLLKDGQGMPVILGHGSWGPVHKAFNTDLRCYAALRIIAHAAFENYEARECFVREARSAAQVRHPTLAVVFPLKSAEDRYLYATEYAAGETLSARIIRDGRLELLHAVKIIGQIAGCLEIVSSAGLLHRNVTPSNVMLGEEDQDSAVKLLDLALPGHAPQANADTFSSPEECRGRQIDIRSGVYSLGAILYFALVGAENYRVFRARSLANEQVPMDEANVPPSVASILKRSLCHHPEERMATFAELREALDAILPAPKRLGLEMAAQSPPPDYAAETKGLREASVRPTAKKISTSASLGSAAESKLEGLTIPSKLLGLAQPGTTLILSRGGQTSDQVVICSRNRFRIGRSSSAGSDLAVRFLPRNSANDAKTRRLSRIHVTAKYDGDELLLFDGDGAVPSANGSTFAGQVLSTESPVALLKSGELQLAEVCSIKVEVRTFEHGNEPLIANLGDWKGPAADAAARPAGAVVFVPTEPDNTITAVWLFSVAAFGASGSSPLAFALPTGTREIGALHYYRGCFWIQPRSAHAISLEGLGLAPTEIAPLVAGQVLEISGAKYSIKIDDVGDRPVRH
jgi:serine/threonine protein kinase